MYNDEVVTRKEREYRDALNERYQETIDALRRRDADVKQVTDKYDVLERDFRYNLALLADRDAELDRCEDQIHALTASLSDKSRQLTDARDRLDDAALTSRRKFLEAEDARRLFEKKMADKDAQLADINKAFEMESRKLSELLSTERESHARQLAQVASEAERRCRGINEQYAGVIFRRDEEHKVIEEELRGKFQTELERAAKLQLELQSSNDQLSHLESQITSSRIRQEENDVIQRCEIVDLKASIKHKDNLLDEAKCKLQETEKKLAEYERELQKNVTKDDCRDETVAEKMKTVEELKQLRKQNDILKEVIKDMRKKSQQILGDKNECGDGNNDLQYELTTLKLKVDKLLNGENCEEDDVRVSKLEEAIAMLKTQMMEGLREKLSSDGEEATFEEVRILLLEQKLEEATQKIGQAVVAEKNELLEEIKNVKAELMSRLEDKKEANEKLRSDAMLDEVRREIVRLEGICIHDKPKQTSCDPVPMCDAVTQVSPAKVAPLAVSKCVTDGNNSLQPLVKAAVIHEPKLIKTRPTIELPKKKCFKLKVRNYNIQESR